MLCCMRCCWCCRLNCGSIRRYGLKYIGGTCVSVSDGCGYSTILHVSMCYYAIRPKHKLIWEYVCVRMIVDDVVIVSLPLRCRCVCARLHVLGVTHWTICWSWHIGFAMKRNTDIILCRWYLACVSCASNQLYTPTLFLSLSLSLFPIQNPVRQHKHTHTCKSIRSRAVGSYTHRMYGTRTTDKPTEHKPKPWATPKKRRIKTFSFYLMFDVISRRSFVHNNIIFSFFLIFLHELIEKEETYCNSKEKADFSLRFRLF